MAKTTEQLKAADEKHKQQKVKTLARFANRAIASATVGGQRLTDEEIFSILATAAADRFNRAARFASDLRIGGGGDV